MAVVYCNRECQTRAWQRHKGACAAACGAAKTAGAAAARVGAPPPHERGVITDRDAAAREGMLARVRAAASARDAESREALQRVEDAVSGGVAPPPDTSREVFLFLGGPLYFNHAFWQGGVAPAWTIVDAFAAAHARLGAAAGASGTAAPASGGSAGGSAGTPAAAARAAEAAIFSAGAVWGLPPRDVAAAAGAATEAHMIKIGAAGGAGTLTVGASVPWLSNVLRLAVTPLHAAAAAAAVFVAVALEVHIGSPAASGAGALEALLAPLLTAAGATPGDGSVAHGGGGLGASAAAAAAAAAAAELLMFVLNTPRRCNAYIYSVAGDAIVLARAALDLDTAALEAGARLVIHAPLPEQRSLARCVCVWCGASPLGRGVRLLACAACARVAYCSAACAAADGRAAHAGQECRALAAGGGGGAAGGDPLVSVTRAATEADAPRSLRVSIPGGGPFAVSLIVRRAHDGEVLPVPMAWCVVARGSE
jgi:hypothetical protein